MTVFDSVAPMNALVTLLGGLPGIQVVQKGAPKGFNRQVGVYVAVGAQKLVRKTTGNYLSRELRYYIGFGYGVDEQPDAAEDVIATAVDALIPAFYADVTLGGTVDTGELDATIADHPRYLVYVGAEFRVYPVIVICTQRQTLALTP